LGGDEGYPAVFAWKGEIMDNATVRIKGQQSRGNTKKKWKVALAAGDLWESPDLVSPVNEFSLHSAATDKSFVREILTSDVQEVGGGMRQQIFPVRLEKNGEFWGLYIYQEQTDGRWRSKYGFSDDAIVFKGEKTSTARLAHLNMPVEEFNRRYNRTTQDWTESREEMRDLIRTVNDPNEQRLIRFAYEHIDIPQVVETLAVMKVAQHIELEHKNHVYVLDPQDGRWRFIAIDHDLNFGRRWRGACQSFCEDVEASTYMNYMQSNMFTRIFIEIPQFRRMLDRRTKTIADAFLAEDVPEKRIADLARLMTADAALDRRKWGSYGERQSMEQAQRILVSRYIKGRRAQFVTGTSILPASQATDAAKALTVDAAALTVKNTGKTTIDLSGMELDGIPARIPAGVVLNAGQSVVFETSRVPDAGRSKNSGLLRVWLPVAGAR
jgi:spore coat protein CotH